MKTALISFCLAGGLWAGGTKQITIVDPTPGWNRPAWTAGVPSNWQAAGMVLPGTACKPGIPTLVVRASSPDGLTGVKLFPRFDFGWSTNPSSMHKIEGCALMRPIPALDFARQFMQTQIPGAQEAGTDPYPGLDQFKQNIQQTNEMYKRQAQSAGLRQLAFASGDAARLRIRSQINGHAVDEWISVRINCNETNMSGRHYFCEATLVREWAPQGGLAEARRLYWDPMGRELIADPAWNRWQLERQARAARNEMDVIKQNGDNTRRLMYVQQQWGLAQIQHTGRVSNQDTEDKALARRLNACDVVDFSLGSLGPQPCPGIVYKKGPNGEPYPSWP
jgi:hypothetical protein